MDINQLTEQLKDVPQNTLIGYAQNPNSVVPQFLALAEIQRRQQLQAQSQPPQSTVANDVLAKATTPQIDPRLAQAMAMQQAQGQNQQQAQAANQQAQQAQAEQMAQHLPENQPGVAQLPSGMGQGFAPGGLVAFANGGTPNDADDEDEDRELAQLYPEPSITGKDWAELANQVQAGIGSLRDRMPQSYDSAVAAQNATQGSDVISNAAANRGVPAELMNRIAGVESAGNPSASNKLSSAKGLMGLTSGTWKSLGGKEGEQLDAAKNADLGALLARKNAEGLKAHLGRNPTYGEVYTAHNFGLSGAKHLMGMDPSMPMSKAVSPLVMKQNPQFKNKTVGEVLGSNNAKMGSGIVALAHGGEVKRYNGDIDPSLVKDSSQPGNSMLADYLASDAVKNAEYKDMIAQENAKLLSNAPAPTPVQDLQRQASFQSTGIPSLVGSYDTSLTNKLAQYQPSIQSAPSTSNMSLKDNASGYINKFLNSIGVSSGSKAPAASNDELDRERSRALATANVNKRDIAANNLKAPAPTPSANLVGEDQLLNSRGFTGDTSFNLPTPAAKPAAPQPLSPEEQYRQDLWNNIQSQSEDLKRQQNMNKYLALMQAGLGMMQAGGSMKPGESGAAAIGAGASQGVSTYAALQKQAEDQAKDLMNQRLGLYKYSTANENAQRRLANEESYQRTINQIRQEAAGNKPTEEERNRIRADQAYEQQVRSIDEREKALTTQSGGSLDPFYQEQFQNQRNALRKGLYERYKVPTDSIVNLPPIVEKPKVEKPGLFSRMFGSSSAPAASSITPERLQEINKKYNL